MAGTFRWALASPSAILLKSLKYVLDLSPMPLSRCQRRDPSVRRSGCPVERSIAPAAAGTDVPGNRHADSLILSLAPKEAKARLRLDSAPPLQAEDEKK